MIPYDTARCLPTMVDPNCKNCKRWADHPDQTWGPRTPRFSCDSSTDENCRYIPIKEQK